MSGGVESVRYKRGSFQILDQLKVPHSKEWVEVPDADAAWSVVKKMQVRGAPLIAIASALGLAVEAGAKKQAGAFPGAAEAAAWLKERMTYLRTSRPTAVNLFNAMDALTAIVEAAAAGAADAATVLDAYVTASEAMLEEDDRANKAMGEHGADAILEAAKKKGRGDAQMRILTICNTGTLACTSWGTALGVIRSLHARGRLERAFACETRPYNQGARLTAFELVEDGIPGTLICDSMAASLMLRQGVDAVIVGADRVAANGDTANKIGTYSLSVLAKHHGVPFFVAAPTTTLDTKTPSGTEIPIEERPAEELSCIVLGGQKHRLAMEGIDCWNPAFDVAPCALITGGIVTEKGLVPRTAGSDDFDVKGMVTSGA